MAGCFADDVNGKAAVTAKATATRILLMEVWESMLSSVLSQIFERKPYTDNGWPANIRQDNMLSVKSMFVNEAGKLQFVSGCVFLNKCFPLFFYGAGL